jgi:hypothetical protein
MTKVFNEVVRGLYKDEFSIKETMQVVKNNIMVYFSWGVSATYNYENKALVLKVNAHHHKGYVVITLDWNDTYIVNIVKTSGRIVATYENVYFDCLQEIIDEKIERIEEYSF